MAEIQPRGNFLIEFKGKYVTDERGDPIAVLLDIEEYQKLLERLEDLEAIKAYDNALLSEDREISFEVAIAAIAKSRQ